LSGTATLPDLARIPVVEQLAQVAIESASLADRYSAIKAILRDGEKTCEAIERIMGVYPHAEMHAPEILPALRSILQISSDMELDPVLSDAGRRQLYLNGYQQCMQTWTLQPEEFPVATNVAAQEYWMWKSPMLLFDGERYLDPDDMPISGEEFLAGWEVDKPTIDIRQAHVAAADLLNEAVALRRWMIPPRAFVEVNAGPFVGVELTEVHDEVYFVWRATSNRYWLTSVGHSTQRFNNPVVLPPEKGGEKVAAVLEVLMAALVRDFWVAEERRKIFDVQERQRPRAKRASGTDRHFVYLPRIRYVSSGLRFDRLNDKLEHAGRARHYVRPFLRKVERPSPLQLEIARRDSVRLPEGFTYVRGHYRGGGESQAIYRSRSAISLLYDVFEPQLQVTDEPFASNWFTFERAVGVLLGHLEFSVRHKAVRGKGDNGIDILAEKGADQVTEIWVVQCKFWAPKNAIGPSIVRELIGSMTDTLHNPTQAVRGMIVTTSYFTPDALRDLLGGE
jgi:Restriction endonuclease